MSTLTPSSETTYPMRINKYLAQKNHATRRGADELIEKGKVFINGRKAVLGDKVNEGDDVQVRHISGERKVYRYFAYNKPRGIITHSPQHGESDIKMTMAKHTELADTFPIGRLDKDSEGLIILTNDGRVTDRLLNPKYVHEKEYRVTTARDLQSDFKEIMEVGVDIGDYVTKPCSVTLLDKRAFAITLTEGKKHQIRRMVAALGNDVDTLTRTRVMNVELDHLQAGAYRPITSDELKTFLASLGI